MNIVSYELWVEFFLFLFFCYYNMHIQWRATNSLPRTKHTPFPQKTISMCNFSIKNRIEVLIIKNKTFVYIYKYMFLLGHQINLYFYI